MVEAGIGGLSWGAAASASQIAAAKHEARYIGLSKRTSRRVEKRKLEGTGDTRGEGEEKRDNGEDMEREERVYRADGDGERGGEGRKMTRGEEWRRRKNGKRRGEDS
ncbi:hypothetical protein AJ79_01783 [Helicocarpus griseus UAMH5409]|uniref:Uncharacterized protein n=1 Tax=Helicocarpus griseus UAMH5409 TaxID=1447875 RepID=A0A2B7Y6E3_9EURO|nr:hypothetical protein AJ79_01783 [Helicocarpus griseus UAMH5409]